MNNKSTDMQVYNESKKSNKNLLVYYSKTAVALYIFKIMFINQNLNYQQDICSPLWRAPKIPKLLTRINLKIRWNINNMLESWDSFSFGFGQIDCDLALFYSFWNKKSDPPGL